MTTNTDMLTIQVFFRISRDSLLNLLPCPCYFIPLLDYPRGAAYGNAHRRHSFYSYNDLLYQMSNYLYRSNRIPSRVLGWLTPEEMTKKLMPISSPRKASKLPENIMDFIYGDVSV